MKAAVFHGPGKPLAIEEVPTPVAGHGEVLLRVAACGICRTDLHYLHGTPTFKPPPLILGHEISGTVTAVGPGVESFKVGDKVLVPPVFSCGHCAFCRAGRGTLCTNQVMVGNHRDGGFAEYVAVPAHQIFPFPANVPLVEGCVISDAVSTPYHAVVNRGEVRPGNTVAVFGCGGVGIGAVHIASLLGATVIAVDVFPAKLEVARTFGATETIDASRETDVAKAIRKLTGGGVDVALEVIGNPKTIEQAFNAVRWGGRVVVVGFSDQNVTLSAGRLMFREIEVRGSLGCPLQDFPRLLELVRGGRLRVAELVTHKFPLERINEGLALLDKGDPTLIRAVAVVSG
jgi:6-hydroxycyclohex-1-ene-1-carbonyl-CoA dehydrogenase